ncbi:MAG: BON domain-containing protein [Kingella sp. (in: b-proteobacteria)]|jgi:hypothetical protein
MKTATKTILALCVLVTLNGCAALVIGGAAVGANSLANHRSTGAQTDDEVMELRIKNNAMRSIRQYNSNSEASMSVVSYNRKILLVGQVQNESEKQLVEQVARSEKNAESVYNYIQVAPVKRTLANVNYDTWITSKVRSRLLTIKGVYAGQVKVVTYNSVVYVMGLLTPEQQNAVVERIRTTVGVQQVVTLFENYQENI